MELVKIHRIDDRKRKDYAARFIYKISELGARDNADHHCGYSNAVLEKLEPLNTSYVRFEFIARDDAKSWDGFLTVVAVAQKPSKIVTDDAALQELLRACGEAYTLPAIESLVRATFHATRAAVHEKDRADRVRRIREAIESNVLERAREKASYSAALEALRKAVDDAIPAAREEIFAQVRTTSALDRGEITEEEIEAALALPVEKVKSRLPFFGV